MLDITSRSEHRGQVLRSQWSHGRPLTADINRANLDCVLFVLSEYAFETLRSEIGFEGRLSQTVIIRADCRLVFTVG